MRDMTYFILKGIRPHLKREAAEGGDFGNRYEYM